jgi:hypothetical protein
MTPGAGANVREATWQMAAPAIELIDAESQQPPGASLLPIRSRWEICFEIMVSAFCFLSSPPESPNPPENYVFKLRAIPSLPGAPHCHGTQHITASTSTSAAHSINMNRVPAVTAAI